jgi:hypothetical protein
MERPCRFNICTTPWARERVWLTLSVSVSRQEFPLLLEAHQQERELDPTILSPIL